MISVDGTDVSFVSHLSGSSLWGRQSLLEMLCLQAVGLRPQQSHRISVDVMGCQWPLMVTTGHYWSLSTICPKSLKCYELLMPNPSGTRTTLAVKPSTQTIASIVDSHLRAWDDEISKHFQKVFIFVPDQLETNWSLIPFGCVGCFN